MTTLQTLRRPDTPPTQIQEANTTCAQGHPWVAETTRWRYRVRPEKQFNGWERDCLICHRNQKREARARASKRRQQKHNTIRPCTTCGALMRPKNSNPTKWPYTVARATNKTCETCHTERRKTL